MKKGFRFAALLITCIFLISACYKPESITKADGSFSIQFINVGQGDSALIECDGYHMLIDAGDKSAGETVYSVLYNANITKLDILAISHYHMDHVGGLSKALSGIIEIDKIISNRPYYSQNATYIDIEGTLSELGTKIDFPRVGDTFKLGSADIEVLDASDKEENDSLVLLITYGSNKFLFTGDIEYNAEKRIIEKFENDKDEVYKIDLIKMPHHGSWQNQNLYTFLRTFDPDYAIISVGNNIYGHPHHETLELLGQQGAKVYQTINDGNIIVKSDGTKISIETRY